MPSALGNQHAPADFELHRRVARRGLGNNLYALGVRWKIIQHIPPSGNEWQPTHRRSRCALKFTRTFALGWDGGPGQSRTADLRFRKPLLYPSELRGQGNFSSILHTRLRASASERLSAHLEYSSRKRTCRSVIGTSRPAMKTCLTSVFTSSGSPLATTTLAVLPTSREPS